MRWSRRRADHRVPADTIALDDPAATAVAPKAALLARGRRAGLPVPDGFVIAHDGAPEPDDLRRWAAGRTAAVRSAFDGEDGEHESMAGWFLTELDVSGPGIVDAVARVRASGDRHPDVRRRDVLVLEMVDARHAGVAFSEPDFLDDLVNVTTGTGDALVSGAVAGERVELSRIGRADRGWPRRLQRLLRVVRRVFGDRPWDVEWADDGRRCWLLQLRPITAPPRRNEQLTIANHAEILPPLPSTLMTSVVADAGPQLFAWYRRFDDTLPRSRDFLHVVAGRPFINLSLLEDLLRHLGLPTALVAGSIGGPPSRSTPARPMRMLHKARALGGLGLAQVTAVARSARIERRARSFGDPSPDSFGEVLDRLGEAYVHLVTGMFPLSSAIGPPLAVLRRAGTLAAHAGRHRTITAELAAALADTRASRRGLADFLDEFGHRGIYESDVARPRYRDDPATIGSGPAAPAGRPATTDTGHSIRWWVTAPVWALASKPLAARERLRHEAMRSFADLRAALVVLAGRAVADGRLRSVDDLWLLETDEVRRLDDGWIPDRSFWAERESRRARWAALDPPPIVGRFDDPSDWTDAPVPDALRGLPLTSGTVRGTAWVLDEPQPSLPPGFEPHDTVLCARSVDAGWTTTFDLAAAVVVETGGDLSHGSILLRERGIPAVTNVAGLRRSVRTGDRIEVRAGSGVVELLEPIDEMSGLSTVAGG